MDKVLHACKRPGGGGQMKTGVADAEVAVQGLRLDEWGVQ